MELKQSMKYTLLISFLVLFVGCATIPEIDKPIQELSFEPEEEYVLDVSDVPQIDPPDFVFLRQDEYGKLIIFDPDEEPEFEAVAVAFPVDQLNRIEAMLTLKDMYKDISREQEALINIDRQRLQAYKEYLMIERQSRILERELRLAAEDAYRKERRDHRIDNIIHRTTLVVTVVGGIAIALL
jgi:hypothetical protein